MIPWLDETSHAFPAIENALSEPNGLLAAGGDLHPQRIAAAYRLGIFPWFSEEDPILWWSPSPRCVLKPKDLHISKSLAKFCRKTALTVTIDQAFAQVIENCANTREDQEGSWITLEMQQAYQQLHQQGIAHSVEVWEADTLVGGLYGLAIGNIFFGESMFSKRSNASKLAFSYLVKQLQIANYQLIDCQVYSPHLASLGAEEITREAFKLHLANIDQAINDYPNLWP